MRLSLFAVAALLASSLAAHADTVYTYTGPNFNTISYANPVYGPNPFTTSDSITGTVTLATPLAANLKSASVTPSAFSFYDGVLTFTNYLQAYSVFIFSTDANGNITEFAFGSVQRSSHFGDLQVSASTYNGIHNRAYSDSYYADNLNVAGSFSSGVTTGAAVTPEPSGFALLGPGLLGIAGVIKRRFA